MLRHYLSQCGWWIPANVCAWAAGLTVGIAAMSPMGAGTPVAAMIARGIAGGALMGLTVGVLTGLTLAVLLYRTSRNEADG